MTATLEQRVRSTALDGVRAFGIIAVVAGHTWPSDAWVSNWLFSWHVPVFFILSGYLWTAERTLRSEVRKRIRTLVVPYIAWFLLVAVVWFTVRAVRGTTPSTEPWRDLILGGFHISRPWSAFWFISALFIATVLYRLLDGYSRVLPWFVGVVALSWCYVDPHSARSLPFAAVQGAVGMLFIGVGVLLRKWSLSIADPLMTGVIFIVTPLGLTVFDILPSMNMKAANIGSPVVTLITSTAISCGLILVARATEHLWPRFIRNVFATITQFGLPIILGHALVLGLLAMFGVEPTPLSLLVATALPVAFGWLIRSTRLRAVLL